MYRQGLCLLIASCLLVFCLFAEIDGQATKASSGFHYGCFKENEGTALAAYGRLFPDFRRETDSLTPKSCIQLCFRKRFRLAGLQFGKECHCTNKNLDLSRQTYDSACDMPCNGNTTEKCGGEKRMNVYSTGLSEYKSPHAQALLGCFKENQGTALETQGRIFPEFREDSNDLTPKTCLKLCFRKGYKLSGVQHGNECYCSNKDLDRTKQTFDAACRMPCAGDSYENCGGEWRMNIYSTGFTGPNPTLPNTPPEPVIPESPVSPSPSTGGGCDESETLYNGKPACKNQVIFFDNFIRRDDERWKPEIKVASKPDNEFTMYGSAYANLYTLGGSLYINPTLNDEKFVDNSQYPFQRSSCTGDASNGECSKNPDQLILPPIQSARITTKHSFSFQYGIIDIEAKLPIGDWLLSEIWLVPVENIYGSFYQSGKIRLVSRGNGQLKYKNGKEMGCETVEGSVMVGRGEKVRGRSVFYTDPEICQHSEYQNFRIIWTPDDISFVVNEEKQSIMQGSNGKKLRDMVDLSDSEKSIFSKSSSVIAPFDQPFYISLGVSAGGIRDFEDGSESNGSPKPWNNTDPKAMYSFWRRRKEWYSTWWEDRSLVIKSIRVTAL